MKAGSTRRTDLSAGTARTLRAVPRATGGNGKLLELYRVLSAEEAAQFLGLAESTVRDMTYRHQLPHVKTGKRGVGYQVLDLIEWLERRKVAATGKLE